MILRRLFERQSSGFYIDIGAHHPFRFSNTCLFYKQGWRGINIDAMPGSMKLFHKYRKRDINLEVGISNNQENLTYYIFNEPALNGFSKELSEKRNGNKEGQYYIVKTINLKTYKLMDILEKYLPSSINIDFFNIDVEGFDLQVLQSNDWNKFRPRVVLVEIDGKCFYSIEQSEESQFLNQCGYMLFAKTVKTAFFINQQDIAC